MNEYTAQKLKVLAGVLLLALCLALIVVGQRNIGWPGLCLMLAGLAGILALLGIYNHGVEHPDGKEKNAGDDKP